MRGSFPCPNNLQWDKFQISSNFRYSVSWPVSGVVQVPLRCPVRSGAGTPQVPCQGFAGTPQVPCQEWCRYPSGALSGGCRDWPTESLTLSFLLYTIRRLSACTCVAHKKRKLKGGPPLINLGNKAYEDIGKDKFLPKLGIEPWARVLRPSSLSIKLSFHPNPCRRFLYIMCMHTAFH